MRTKADYLLCKDIETIEQNGFKDINPRPRYADGTPAHTISVNHQYRSYDLSAGEFPITTLRPIAWKTAIKEILWIYQDASNDLDLLHNKYNVFYWDEWPSKDMPGTIGARYGEVVRRYDLMNNLLNDIQKDPYGRRHIIDLWQYKELNETDGLYPCAFLTDWNVRGEYLDMILFQRSGDMLMASGAGNVNEVQYAALLMMVARHCGYKPGKFTHVIANEQLYDHHLEAAKTIKERFTALAFEDAGFKVRTADGQFRDTYSVIDELAANKELIASLPVRMMLNPEKTNFYDFTVDDFQLENYIPVKPQLNLEIAI